ncbi:Subtilisin inhibitor-like [Kibdelosporangium aridum]|uniref:Subtilisin inhibitor-like n=2 Tax=Kibdelosporangium aridum TaxID=2030 RepID=A0A1W2FWZ8_KIBAR|nr:Subtilisin inhibitor-like [Kibdelosporangium aridum]
MRHMMSKIFIIAAVAAMMISGVSASAAGYRSTDSPSSIANSVLRLTISEGETAKAIPYAASTLTCDPDGGGHPHATKACDRLREVHGDFTELRGNPGTVCTTQWDPVTVTADGIWQDRFVHWQHTYSNTCQLASTDPIFAF